MSRILQTPHASLRDVKIVVPISKGGTGVSSEADLPVALSIVGKHAMGAINGVGTLDVNGLVPNDQLPLSAVPWATIDGPDEIFPGQTVTFTITNYDINTPYVVSVSAGTINRNGKQLIFNAPGSAQSVTLTVNQRQCVFAVKPAAPVKPTIVAPVYNGAIAGSTYTFTSSAFAGSALPHAASDWQISVTADFSTLAYQTLNDVTNKVTWSMTGLVSASLLFARVRHKAADGSYSAWSEPSRFSIA
jgi:molybdopterin biosynthesis enzyme MoaB